MRDEVNRYIVFGYAIDEYEAFFANGGDKKIDKDKAFIRLFDEYLERRYEFYANLKNEKAELKDLEAQGQDVSDQLNALDNKLQKFLCEAKKLCLSI